MQTGQCRIIVAIVSSLERLGYEIAQVPSYPNTGTIFIYRDAQVRYGAMGSVSYNFQPDTYTLSLTWEGKRIPSQRGRADYFDFYQRYDQDAAFWDVLAQTVPAVKKKKG